MEMTEDQYEKNFKGFVIVDCAVRSSGILYFSLIETDPNTSGSFDEEEEEQSWLRRRIAFFIDSLSPDKRWGHGEFKNSDDYHISVSRNPREQLISVDDDGQVYVVGSGINEMEKRLGDFIEDGILRGGVSRCRTIDGYAYIAGGGRTVAVRKNRNDWLRMMEGLPYSDDTDWDIAGFEDIDGFDANDIYCVGGEGDVWHFNGTNWTQIPFPSNIDLHSVCCGGDGAVYISGYGGTTFKGRGQKWKQIYKGDMTIPFKDMIWHESKVWCTSDFGLWQITGEKLKSADVDDEIRVCSGHISAHENVLLLAGHGGAACKIGDIWHKLF